MRAIDSVTGVSSTTVVTLSRTAESTAVATASITSSRNGSPRDRWMATPATYSKKPVLLSPRQYGTDMSGADCLNSLA